MEKELLYFFYIVSAAALAPVIVDRIQRVKIPVVVIEIALGVIIGPQVLGWAEASHIIEAFSEFGLAFLFFLAGYEIDFDKIKGKPLKLAGSSWVISLVGALILAFILQAAGVVNSSLYVGIAMTTTAIGALLPMLSDAGELETDFGNHTVAYGAAGEFAPIVMMALLLEGERSGLTSALVLNAFVIIVFFALLAAQRWWPERLMKLVGHTMHSSGQLAVRITTFLLICFIALANMMGLDFLLGAFAAGLIIAQFVKRVPQESKHETEILLAKFEGIGYGLLIPIFFIVSGIKFDLSALVSSSSSLAMLPIFLILFFIVRGLPALFFYRKELAKNEQLSLGFFGATQLPLVIAITGLGVESGRMANDMATAMVGAAMLSVFIYPLVGFALRNKEKSEVQS
jgi:Kef-type K+ transport system membrane component KefB